MVERLKIIFLLFVNLLFVLCISFFLSRNLLFFILYFFWIGVNFLGFNLEGESSFGFLVY